MEKRRVLLVTDREALELKGIFFDPDRYKTEIVRSFQAGLDMLANKDFDVVIADLKGVRSHLDLFREAKEKNFWVKTVSVANFPLEIFLVEIASEGLSLNAVSGGDSFDFGELSLAIEKLFSKDIFGIEKYLAKDAKSFEVELQHSNRKQECMDKAALFAAGFTQDRRILSAVQNTVDELFMNAFFDAPCNEKGEYTYLQEDRTKSVTLPHDEAVVLRCACDGKNLAISMTDRFGSLERSRFFGYLVRCITSSDTQVEIKPGGSGVGVYNVLQNSSSFVVNLHPLKRTEVISILDIGSSMREFQKKAKSFHIFTVEEKIEIGESLSVERQDTQDALFINFYGIIDENSIFGRVFETDKNRIVVNLRGVKRINSCGVREWVNALRSIPQEKRLEFVECSLAMIKQFNMISNFGSHGRIRSFMAPYFCSRCNRQFDKVVVLKEHLDKLLDLKAPDFTCSVCQDVLKFDDLEDKYFQFIVRQESTL
ncbi:MAG: hypothetical protein NTU54_06925 [Candidatus Omnitrophica bacterium]|nr:hypothetical protein [Candidatus Omnitrophota bacterium]